MVPSDENQIRSWLSVEVNTFGGGRMLQYCPPNRQNITFHTLEKRDPRVNGTDFPDPVKLPF